MIVECAFGGNLVVDRDWKVSFMELWNRRKTLILTCPNPKCAITMELSIELQAIGPFVRRGT